MEEGAAGTWAWIARDLRRGGTGGADAEGKVRVLGILEARRGREKTERGDAAAAAAASEMERGERLLESGVRC